MASGEPQEVSVMNKHFKLQEEEELKQTNKLKIKHTF